MIINNCECHLARRKSPWRRKIHHLDGLGSLTSNFQCEFDVIRNSADASYQLHVTQSIIFIYQFLKSRKATDCATLTITDDDQLHFVPRNNVACALIVIIIIIKWRMQFMCVVSELSILEPENATNRKYSLQLLSIVCDFLEIRIIYAWPL